MLAISLISNYLTTVVGEYLWLYISSVCSDIRRCFDNINNQILFAHVRCMFVNYNRQINELFEAMFI